MRTQLEHWEHSPPSPGTVGHSHVKARVEIYPLGWTWGCFLLRITHADSSHGCYWGWHTSLNGCYWDKSFRSSVHPQSTKALAGDRCWVVAGDIGGRLQVCVCMASGFILSCPPLLATILFADYSVCQSVCSCPDSTLTLTPFSFCLCTVCHRAVLIMWVQASSTVCTVRLHCINQPTCEGSVYRNTGSHHIYTKR